MKTLLAAAALALIALTTALAQQRTLYGSDGRVVGRATTDSTGTTTLDRDGRAVTRESPTSSGTIIYDGASGRVLGKTTKEQRQ